MAAFLSLHGFTAVAELKRALEVRASEGRALGLHGFTAVAELKPRVAKRAETMAR